MNLWGTIKSDMAVNDELRIKVFLLGFRLAHASRRFGPARFPVIAAYKVLSGLTGIELPSSTQVGPGLHIQHGFGLVIHGRVVIGASCHLKQGVTIGVRKGDGPVPVLEDRVQVGAGATIIGDVTIGYRAIVGAGAVVLDDVPAGAVAFSPKAKIRMAESPVGTIGS